MCGHLRRTSPRMSPPPPSFASAAPFSFLLAPADALPPVARFRGWLARPHRPTGGQRAGQRCALAFGANAAATPAPTGPATAWAQAHLSCVVGVLRLRVVIVLRLLIVVRELWAPPGPRTASDTQHSVDQGARGHRTGQAGRIRCESAPLRADRLHSHLVGLVVVIIPSHEVGLLHGVHSGARAAGVSALHLVHLPLHQDCAALLCK